MKGDTRVGEKSMFTEWLLNCQVVLSILHIYLHNNFKKKLVSVSIHRGNITNLTSTRFCLYDRNDMIVIRFKLDP